MFKPRWLGDFPGSGEVQEWQAVGVRVLTPRGPGVVVKVDPGNGAKCLQVELDQPVRLHALRANDYHNTQGPLEKELWFDPTRVSQL